MTNSILLYIIIINRAILHLTIYHAPNNTHHDNLNHACIITIIIVWPGHANNYDYCMVCSIIHL